LLETIGKQETVVPLLMDRAYETSRPGLRHGIYVFRLLFPLKQTPYNAIERFFRRLKAFRAIFTCYDKLDSIFSASVLFASIIIVLRCVNTP